MSHIWMTLIFTLGIWLNVTAIATAQGNETKPCVTESEGEIFDPLIRQYQHINQLTCQGYWEEAVTLMQQMVVAQNADASCPLCAVALPLGEAQIARQEWQQAFDTYNFALSNTIILDGSEYDALGYQLVVYNQIDTALIAFQQLGNSLGHLEPSHNQAFAYTRLGDVLLATDQWDAAQTAYETALQINPDEPFAYQGLGLVWMAQEQWQEAIAAFEKTLALHPTLTEPAQYIQQIQQHLNTHTSHP